MELWPLVLSQVGRRIDSLTVPEVVDMRGLPVDPHAERHWVRRQAIAVAYGPGNEPVGRGHTLLPDIDRADRRVDGDLTAALGTLSRTSSGVKVAHQTDAAIDGY
jgi:hypothetical protein